MGNMKKKSFAVLGLGKFGQSVAREMASAGVDVLAADISEEHVHAIADAVTCAMRVDVCDSEAMGSLGLSNLDGVIIAITGSLDASIMATILAKEAGVLMVIAKAKDEIHARILKKVGADRTVIPEKESGIRMARCLVSGNFIDFIELSDRISMVEIPVKPEWIGKNLKELHLREKAGINVIALRMGKELTVSIDPEQPLNAECSLWITIDKRNIRNLI